MLGCDQSSPQTIMLPRIGLQDCIVVKLSCSWLIMEHNLIIAFKVCFYGITSLYLEKSQGDFISNIILKKMNL